MATKKAKHPFGYWNKIVAGMKKGDQVEIEVGAQNTIGMAAKRLGGKVKTMSTGGTKAIAICIEPVKEERPLSEQIETLRARPINGTNLTLFTRDVEPPPAVEWPEPEQAEVPQVVNADQDSHLRFVERLMRARQVVERKRFIDPERRILHVSIRGELFNAIKDAANERRLSIQETIGELLEEVYLPEFEEYGEF